MTYLAIDTVTSSQVDQEETVFAFCSWQCRALNEPMLPWTIRDDSSYEFDEICANCGREIPASAWE
jgi:hypothetical protein